MNNVFGLKMSLILKLIFQDDIWKMSRALGTTPSTIRIWRKGDIKPGFRYCAKLRELGISVEWLHDDTDRTMGNMIRQCEEGKQLREQVNTNLSTMNIESLYDIDGVAVA
jgi:hypothetical protein